MNYLAHMVCSNDSPASMLGNFIADFVKGNVEGRFPHEVVNGILHHRKADLFTDSHAVFRASRRLISSSRRRYAGVIIDVLYDHFLTINWDRYCSIGLYEFVERVYENLQSHRISIPYPVPMVIEKMVREDWLRRYGTVEGIDQTFRRISGRLRRENTLNTAVEELECNYVLLQDHFHCFFPQLMAQFRTHEQDIARVLQVSPKPLKASTSPLSTNDDCRKSREELGLSAAEITFQPRACEVRTSEDDNLAFSE